MSGAVKTEIATVAEIFRPKGIRILFEEFPVIREESKEELCKVLDSYFNALPILLRDGEYPPNVLVWAGYINLPSLELVSRNEYWEERIEKDYFHREPEPVKPAPEDVDESAVLDSVAATLEKEGWIVHKRYRVQHGEVDAVALRKNQFMIIEAKGSTKISEMAQALGQLLTYREQIANFNVTLAVALPRMPNKFAQSLLAKHGVRILARTHE